MINSLKKSLGTGRSVTTNVLHTPVWTCYGDNVLEGFTADAEHMGKVDETDDYFGLVRSKTLTVTCHIQYSHPRYAQKDFF